MSEVNIRNKAAKDHIKENGKLPPRFKERWLEALNSGKYAKGTGVLCKTETLKGVEVPQFCCLGVAGRIQGLSIDDLSCNGFLEEDNIEVAKKKKKQIPKILQDSNPVTTYLATLNDSTKTFKKVISWIDKNL